MTLSSSGMKSVRWMAAAALLIGVGAGVAVAQEFFPRSYDESRAVFRAETAKASEKGAFHVPSKVDPDLTVDWALFPALAEKRTLLVLVSGVHGPEAHAGAAIQRQFLKQTLPSLDRSRLGVLLVHAMNPYGYKYGRRVTENNVDLNRNFELDPGLFSNTNEGYEAIRGILEPHRKVRSPFLSLLKISARIGAEMASGRFTRAQLNQAVSGGQYRYPIGLEFGGQMFEPQVGFLVQLLRARAAGYSQVVFLDLHTGLGEKYQLHMILGERKAQNDPALFEKLLLRNPHRAEYVLNTGDEPGFYHTYGDSIDLVPVALPGVRLLTATAEFGTVGTAVTAQIAELNKMVLENQGAHHGFGSKRVERKVKRDFVEVFFPSGDEKWKETVLRKARLLLDGVIGGL